MVERIILITGASGGLAQAIVGNLPETDQLILVGRSQERLESLYGERAKTLLLPCDISDSQALADLVDLVYKRFGRLDALINNAGYGTFKAYDDYTAVEVEAMFAVNTFAVMTLSRLVGQNMAEQGHGHIVTIASMAGHMATSKASVYAASKFAVIGFSNSLRLELADSQVYVTTVNPGPIKTAFFEQADPSGEYLKSVGAFALDPDKVAKKVVACLGKNKRELNLPWSMALAHKAYSLFPKLADFLTRKVFNFK